MTKIRLVCATRSSESDFSSATILGRSLAFYKQYSHEFEVRLFANNSKGLPSVYNLAIAEVRETPRILVFVHDDLHLVDLFWPTGIREGLANFDLLGLVGCKRHYPNQVSWMQYLRSDGSVASIEKNAASGAIAHLSMNNVTGEFTRHPLGGANSTSLFENMFLSYFGPTRQEVCLLDGVLLACNSDTLIANDIHFDERFDFHFYDMDLCRQFEKMGLRMATWPISALHASRGAYDDRYRIAYQKYVGKWPASV